MQAKNRNPSGFSTPARFPTPTEAIPIVYSPQLLKTRTTTVSITKEERSRPSYTNNRARTHAPIAWPLPHKQPNEAPPRVLSDNHERRRRRRRPQNSSGTPTHAIHCMFTTHCNHLNHHSNNIHATAFQIRHPWTT